MNEIDWLSILFSSIWKSRVESMTEIILSERLTTQIHLDFYQKFLSVEFLQQNSSMADGRICELGEELGSTQISLWPPIVDILWSKYFRQISKCESSPMKLANDWWLGINKIWKRFHVSKGITDHWWSKIRDRWNLMWFFFCMR